MKTNVTPPSMEAWEASVRRHARWLAYPPTPDVTRGVMAQLASRDSRTQRQRWHFPLSPRRVLWTAVILIAMLIGLWSVPPVRAAILEFLQIGAVRIWLVEPTPMPKSHPSATAAATAALSTPMPPTPRIETASPFNLAGLTTLEDAATRADFAIPLPTYPQGIGLPDAVFYQELDGAVVVLVWMDEEEPDQALYSLHILGDNVIASKANPLVVSTTSVNGHSAAWTSGPYLLTYEVGGTIDWQLRYLVSGRVLIWEADGLTYRLESNLSMEEAVRMAESLQAHPQ